MKLVRVEWLDAHGIVSGWEALDELKTLPVYVCTTVGWLLEDTERLLTLAQTAARPEDETTDAIVDGRITIPRCAVRSVDVLAVEEGR